MENTVKIQVSKVSAFLLLLGSLAFIALSIFYFVYMGPFDDVLVYIFYGIGDLFFGFCGMIAIRKLFRGQGGVEISDVGITFYSYNLERNLIKWSEIVSIEEYSIVDQRFVNIFIKFPEFYIDKQKSGFNRTLMKLNNGLAGSPIQISATTLDITHEELLALLQERLEKSKAGSGTFTINSNISE